MQNTLVEVFYLCPCDLIRHNFDLFKFMFDTDVVFLSSKQLTVFKALLYMDNIFKLLCIVKAILTCSKNLAILQPWGGVWEG